MRGALVLLTIALAGCDAMPRDFGGTTQRIAQSRTIRVGVTGVPDPAGERFLAALAKETGARIVLHAGPLEPLVAALDRDQLDLLLAPVRAEALLAEEVALSPALEGEAAEDRSLATRAAVRNGENRWLMTVERVARRNAGT